MSIDTRRGVPGVPLAALDAIQDQNTRQVLRAIIDGWHVRNGVAGDGSSRFVTASELNSISGVVDSMSRSLAGVSQRQQATVSSSDISRIITDIEASVMESQLWKELGDRVTLINRDLLDRLEQEAIDRQAAITTEQQTRQTADESLAQQITTVTASVNQNASAIQQETTARANADTALNQIVTTQLATVNSNLAALQTQSTTTANNVSTLSQTVTTLQAQTKNNTAALSTEATVRANADNDIYAKYSVKIDTNGYVSGFGLISTANNSVPTSDFIVRADRFSIGSPSGPGITPTVPFTVLTTTDADGNPPGVYMREAMIRRASIGTLFLDGNAVTSTKYNTSIKQNVTISKTSEVLLTSVSVNVSQDAGSASIVALGSITFYPSDSNGVTAIARIRIDGLILHDSAVSIRNDGVFVSCINGITVPTGSHSIALYAVLGDPGEAEKSNVTCISSLVVQAGFR